MWPSTCLGDVSLVLRRPAFVSPRVASVRLHLLSPCRLVRSKHIQKKMLRSTAPCYVHTKLLMIRQTRTINGLSLCSCLLKEQVQERLNSPDLQSNVVLRNLRCMATHVSGGVYIYINSNILDVTKPQTNNESVCVRVKCSLTLSTCLSNELALQQNVRQDRKFQAQRDLQVAVLVQDAYASMRGAVAMWSIECVRDKVRDTDSDYVMRKPSRCWLGAVPSYWNVVASCFRFSSFAENTSAALAPRAGISQPILLLFFLFSCSWICLQNLASDFFYPVSKFSGVRKKTELT